MKEKIESINTFLKNGLWCDFEIFDIKGKDFKIIGSKDFTYYHEIEITFKEIAYIQCKYEWKTDTANDVFLIPEIEEQRLINMSNQIEQGYHLIKIISEDTEPFYISSKDIEVKFEKVIY